MKHLYRIFLIAVTTILCGAAFQGTLAQQLETRDVITGLDTPWEILWGPDGWIWVTERGGRVSRVNPETGERKVLITVPGVYEQSESGLLGMAVYAAPPADPIVFLVYTYLDGSRIRERLVRYMYNGDALVNPTTLLEGIIGNTTHVGSRLLISPGANPTLFMTTGDAQNQPSAQDQASVNGKFLRMELDGTAPADNPRPNAPSPANLVWTSGHRNPQGMVFGPDGTLYSSEHGPSNDDEINIIQKGRNYGWPTVQGYCDTPPEQAFCADSNVVEPIMVWTPTLAAAGLDYYTSDAIPEWQGALLLVTLKEADLRVLKLNQDGTEITGTTTYFDNQFGRLRDLCISPDGRVFIAVTNRDGRGAPQAGDDRIVEIKATGSSSASISPPDIQGSAFCAGATTNVEFTATGEFSPANVFTIQLSNAAGSFTTPVNIGSLNGVDGGSVSVTFPAATMQGGGYRLRVISSNPPATSTNSDILLTINAIPSADAGGEKTVCLGKSVTLAVPALNGATYQWTPAQGLSCTDCASPVASPTVTTTYQVQVVSAAGCSATGSVSVAVIPVPDKPTVDRDGLMLTASAAVGYQWNRNGAPIEGAAAQQYLVTQNGEYTVTIFAENGCTATSDPVEVITSSVPVRTTADDGITIYPQPAGEILTVDVGANRTGEMKIAIVDINGKEMLRMVHDAGSARNIELPLHGLASGTYILQLELSEGIVTRKFVRE